MRLFALSLLYLQQFARAHFLFVCHTHICSSERLYYIIVFSNSHCTRVVLLELYHLNTITWTSAAVTLTTRTFSSFPQPCIRILQKFQAWCESTACFRCITHHCGFVVALMRFLQAAWKDENRYISRIFDWLFDIWYCFENCSICSRLYCELSA